MPTSPRVTVSPLGFFRRCLLPALVLLALGHPAHAASPGQVVTFTSAPSVRDLQCPNRTTPPKPSPAQQPSYLIPTQWVTPTGNQIPTPTELGTLARTVIRAQPLIAQQTIPGLSLRNLTQPRHIAIWGDSHIASGPFMPTLLAALHANGIPIGAYYLPATMGRANVTLPQLRAACTGSAWTTALSYTSATPLSIGPGLANRTAAAGPQSYFWLDLRNTNGRPVIRQLRIVYQASPASALGITVNDGADRQVALTASDDTQTLTLRGDALISTVKLRVTRGNVTLHGFIVDYANPPMLTFDVFGIPSATIRGWVNARPNYLRQSMHDVTYDGVVLEYGTNEGNTQNFDRDKYAADLAKALAHLRLVFPSASCVLVGPPDRGVPRNRGATQNLLLFSRIHQQIQTTQREVGRHFDCVAWSWQDLMGGPGGSYGWAHASPPLMGRDLTHLSSAGYTLSGQALARSLGWQR